MSGIIEHFSILSYPRTKEHKKEHKLIDIIFITIAAVICSAEDWNDIEEYGGEKEEWLKTILELPFGISYHDTFNRVFSLIDPDELQKCFIGWVQGLGIIYFITTNTNIMNYERRDFIKMCISHRCCRLMSLFCVSSFICYSTR